VTSPHVPGLPCLQRQLLATQLVMREQGSFKLRAQAFDLRRRESAVSLPLCCAMLRVLRAVTARACSSSISRSNITAASFKVSSRSSLPPVCARGGGQPCCKQPRKAAGGARRAAANQARGAVPAGS